MWNDKQRGIRVSQEELLCKNACGYYGNPAWQGFCSKCWRERARPESTSREPRQDTRPSNDGAPPTFSKFEEKKNIEKGRRINTMRRLFWGTPSPPKHQEPSESHTNVLKAYQSLEPGDFPGFLKILKSPSSQRLQSRCTAFLNTMEAYHHLPVQKQSDLVQDFFQSFAEYFSSFPEAQVTQIMEHVEKLIMTRLHKWVFCHDSCDDEQKDLALQRRIRSLNWVTPQMLSVPFPDKKTAVTGDPFLPAITGLIYVVLKANPPRLHSNMQYVIRFGLPHSLMAGESGYYFTNLSCAVAFIEKLDGPALNLSPEEFEAYMLRQRAPSAGKKRLQVSNDTQHLFEELTGRQEKLDQGMDALNTQLQTWVQAVHSQLDEATAQLALVQKEITAQAELSQVFSSSSHDASLQKDGEDQSLLVCNDEHAGPKDTDS
ncbi:rab5 GDP/GTP exchange factor-like isoform X2 [Micropterus dolomieu]|uniref:rab5 GDP/GTP exchange factor-like isoform X2 n=1 Tax=Micropterus dolomieu TaxID=147949 RepID=UPI001E8EAB8D|nr:rab5 GDP/GTP exchange factor-like isoform X2 [Micropterus dolomieu]